MAFQLQILHGSDFEGGIPALNDAVGFSTVANALKDDFANTLILSSGDNYMPGPFFSASSDPSVASTIGAALISVGNELLASISWTQATSLNSNSFVMA